ncbi:hypothetical protein C1645_735724 [Glomus cerebriforme]|uniref:Uncharacterized protein n=1 Tax=Glomus cerebriforme TaxID=658196 RepID=A0A397T4G7_9GLOM|nr:hypothetical protein C1645_735724 [Glomus cerebriforme]
MAIKNNFQKLDMYNKSVAKNINQYIEVGKQKEINLEDYTIPFLNYNQRLDDTKKSNESFFSSKKLISNKLNAQKFHEEYSVADLLSRTSQELIFITLFDENELVMTKVKRIKSEYEGSLKTIMKKDVLKYNNSNENTDYLRNKNHRSISSQKSVQDDEKYDKNDESDKSDK